MRVTLLGTISAITHDGSVTIAGDKQQAVLALLALAAPNSVSDDRLVDELWGELPPKNATNALQAQVSTLRRTLGRDAVQRVSNGYSLTVQRADVDALRLEHLVQRGRDASAASDQPAAGRCFEEALALVQGEPLGDLAAKGLLRTATAWLQGLVLDAREGMVDTLLTRSRHADVVETLRSLVAAQPLRERFHAQLMIALYRCGRQGDALRAYRHAKEVLVDELGVDPGPELQELERAILCHDASLAAPITLAAASSSSALPTSLTSFIGRQAELVALQTAIDTARLVTVVGPAGVGKSRVVLEAARGLAREHEVWYVELAPVTDAIAVPEAVASAVGARDDTAPDDATMPRRPVERTIDRIGDRAVILILDNCEHVIDGAAQCVSTLIERCGSLTVIATSREPLAIAGEHQVALDTLGNDEAVELFAERARAVQPRFVVDGVGDDLRELCRRLDGLPLAIELAAARAKTLPLPEILQRLEHRFQLLTTTERHAPARHRALSAALDASYDLLFDEEKRLFRMIAVFAGGITVDAAEEMCGPEALDTLTALADRSMLVADVSGKAARFRMLESLRQYGVERLDEHGELDDAVSAYVQWCTGLAEAADTAIRGPGQLDALARLDAEHDNLRAALAHLSVSDPNSGLRLIGALLVPWFARDRRQEARHWAEACLAAAHDAPPNTLARVFAGVGLMPESSGWTGIRGELESELELAQARQRHGIQLSTEAGDDVLASRCKATLVSVLTRSVASRIAVDPKEVMRLIDEAVEVFDRVDDHFFVALVHDLEVIWHLVEGEVAAAEEALVAARRFAERSADPWTRGSVLWMEGILPDAVGDTLGAYRCTEQALRLYDEVGTGHVVVAQAQSLALLADRRGELELAAQWRTFVEQRIGRSRSGNYDGTVLAAVSNQVGLDARRRGDLQRAKRAHLDARAWLTPIGATPGSAFTESCLRFLMAELGDAEAAASHHTQALNDAEAIGDPDALAMAFEGVAASFADGDGRWAAELLGAAQACRDAFGHEPATHRNDVDAIERRARDELGDDAFATATLRGAGWTRAEALAAVRARRPR